MIRATTSFSVETPDAPVTHAGAHAAVRRALVRLEDERGCVEKADVTQGEADARGNLVVQLDLVFRSQSYGDVDDAMLELTACIAAALQTMPGRPHMESRETQLVPARMYPDRHC